jgi:glycosyltransferase involved in cell wall biosynthesis
MMSEKRFSIIIPTYNRADLVMETLETVFNQSYPGYEVLVVDNCSTDNTQELLRPLAESGRIRYIRHDRNYERARSRNTGIKNATGEFVTFLDSDDFLYPDCLKDANQFIRENPGILFFQVLYELVNNKRERIYSYSFPSLKNQYKAIASGNFISCIGGFIHRDIYQTMQFNEDPRMIGAEDHEVWFQVLARYRMGRVSKIDAAIREHPQRSVNHGAYDNLRYQLNYLVNKIKTDALLFDKFGAYLNRLQASYMFMEAIVANQLKEKKRARKILWQILQRDISVLATSRFYKVLYHSIKS